MKTDVIARAWKRYFTFLLACGIALLFLVITHVAIGAKAQARRVDFIREKLTDVDPEAALIVFGDASIVLGELSEEELILLLGYSPEKCSRPDDIRLAQLGMLDVHWDSVAEIDELDQVVSNLVPDSWKSEARRRP